MSIQLFFFLRYREKDVKGIVKEITSLIANDRKAPKLSGDQIHNIAEIVVLVRKYRDRGCGLNKPGTGLMHLDWSKPSK